jgi:hypothetical protein
MPELEQADETLAERVAALEAAFIAPLVRPSSAVLTDEQAAGFRERLAEAAGRYEMRLLPQAPPLTPEQIRCLLRECVTVVKPGETLIVRVPVTWNPEQVSNYQKNFNDWARWLELPFRVIVVIGDELGIAETEPGGVPGSA